MISNRRKLSFLTGLAVLFPLALFASALPTLAQERYDDHEMKDRVFFTLGGFTQTDIRTTIRVDTTTMGGAIGAGTVIGLESLFDVDDKVTTVRTDGWYRFNKKHRVNWTYWRTTREGTSTYNGTDPVEIGSITVNPGDNVVTHDKSLLITASWAYSFVNTRKYEAWLGAGVNFQKFDETFDVNIGGGMNQYAQSAKATVPIPTLNIGGLWHFNDRWQMFVSNQLFGLRVGDYSGRLENTRVLAEFNINDHFGIGAGIERYNFEVTAEGSDFRGELDTSYSAGTLYLKGQF